MKISTSKFGEIEIDENLIFDFVEPVIGFNDLKKYALVEHNNNELFRWLLSVENGEVTLPVTTVSSFGINYSFEIDDATAQKIDLTDIENLLVLNIANIPNQDPRNTTVNLLGPILINLTNKKALQLILQNDNFSARHKIFDNIPTNEKQAASKLGQG